MHIVTASDENYLPGVLVLIASAAHHNPGARFTLLASGYSPAAKAKVAEMARRTGAKVALRDMAPEVLAGLEPGRAHLSQAAFLRLFIPELLPDESRVIYMDCDMVCTGPLDAAWQVDLAGQALAAVPCPAPTRSALADLGLAEGAYVNSGFAVMNLDLWRAEVIGAECLRRLRAPGCSYVTQDESAINDVCRGRIRLLPSGFNLYASEHLTQAALDDPASIRVIHYVTSPKPWNGRGPLWQIWAREAEPLRDLLPAPKPLTFRQRLSIWNRARREAMGAALGKARYANRRRNARVIADRIVAPYLTRRALG